MRFAACRVARNGSSGPARPPWSRQVCVSRVGSPVADEWPAAGAAGGKCPPQAENFGAFSLSKQRKILFLNRKS